MKFLTESENETRRVGAEFASGFCGGEILLLEGDLGAGKTAFCKGVAEALRINAEITSPTFTVMNSYESGRLKFYHIDAYRLKEGEAEENGLTEFFGRFDSVVAVEWPQMLGTEINAGKVFRVSITRLDDSRREINIYEQ